MPAYIRNKEHVSYSSPSNTLLARAGADQVPRFIDCSLSLVSLCIQCQSRLKKLKHKYPLAGTKEEERNHRLLPEAGQPHLPGRPGQPGREEHRQEEQQGGHRPPLRPRQPRQHQEDECPAPQQADILVIHEGIDQDIYI